MLSRKELHSSLIGTSASIFREYSLFMKIENKVFKDSKTPISMSDSCSAQNKIAACNVDKSVLVQK